jgi:hypothetical protein
MNDKIATAFLMALAGALVVGILYVVFAPVPEEIGAGNSKEAERIRATVECIKQSGGSNDRDYRLAGYKAAKCAEQSAAEGAETR